MPAIVGRNGIEAAVPIGLNDIERAALQRSADALKAVIDGTLAES